VKKLMVFQLAIFQRAYKFRLKSAILDAMTWQKTMRAKLFLANMSITNFQIHKCKLRTLPDVVALGAEGTGGDYASRIFRLL